MNFLKLTLLFCCFTTILCGQQEYPGYVVLSEGDTLRGRIAINDKKVKFRHEGLKTKYIKSDLVDYGYYGNNVFFSKPDEIAPAEKAKTKGIIVLTNGDTLKNFQIYSIHFNSIKGYFKYPEYIKYEAKKGELSELIIQRDTQNDIIDLIKIEGYPRKKDIFPMYAVRVFDNGLKAYNISRSKPYLEPQTYPNAVPFASRFGILGIIVSEVIIENRKLKIIDTNGGYDDWIIHKNGKIYTINTIVEWKKKFNSIFEKDLDFLEYLKKRKIKNSNIEGILRAYGDFIK